MVATEAESLDLLVNPFAKFSICWLRRKPKFSNYPSSQKTKVLQQRVEPEAETSVLSVQLQAKGFDLFVEDKLLKITMEVQRRSSGFTTPKRRVLNLTSRDGGESSGLLSESF